MSPTTRDMDSEVPRVNLDDYRRLAEPAERVAAEDVDAGMLADLTAEGIVAYDEDGVAPTSVLIVHNARQRGMEWGDTYPGNEDVKTPLLRAEGGYINLPLASGESVEGDEDELVPAGGGEVRAATGEDADDAVIGRPTESIDNSDGDGATAVATEVYF